MSDETNENEIENHEGEETSEEGGTATATEEETTEEPVGDVRGQLKYFDRDITSQLHRLCDPEDELSDPLCVALSEIDGRPIFRFGYLDRRYEENDVVGGLHLGGDANPLFFKLPEHLALELQEEVNNEKTRGNPIFNVLKRRIKTVVSEKLGYKFDKRLETNRKIQWSGFEFMGHKTPEASRKNVEFQQRMRANGGKSGGGNDAADRMSTAQKGDVAEEL